jgi:hypothetical protein
MEEAVAIRLGSYSLTTSMIHPMGHCFGVLERLERFDNSTLGELQVVIRVISASASCFIYKRQFQTRLTSLPGSRDCPRLETLSHLGSSRLRLRSYKYVNHLLLSSSSLSTKRSIRDNLMCSVDRTIDQLVAAVHLCPNFSPYVEKTKRAGENEIRCAGFVGTSGLC